MKLIAFLAILLTALALVPAGAHLFALPHKITLGRDQYFAVQAIYRGWALFGVVLIAAVAADAVLAVGLRHQPWPFRWALAALALMLSTLAVFFVWTHPANVATANWTVAPEDWAALRTRWEYAHAANAVLTFAALCCITLAVLGMRT